ncbi:MAG: ubiquinone/menaquinone biosynthesis methyltransferase [Betaproteobacteria bacterium AqS2]|uniref:Ubiquinone/menaquinone biosynthesis C-methyltransferase UbiE n=1 Tax=Candidatus Amphirhobacter heronislandensis TaxID=1732024 RepID=A0A930XYL4_9GAMM|nr:ubiquinone/menaquinone biosynthesis methyltransferase [Betaproteobacteria bacterium AqS2]
MAEKRAFGFAAVPPKRHEQGVAGVFADAAPHYDLCNDVLSGGLHRLWKRFFVAHARPRPDEHWLDLACGSGDVAALLRRRGCEVTAADASEPMLALARARFASDPGVAYARCRAEDLPFAAGAFDGAACAFGLRNFTDPPAAVAELARVLRPGAPLLILEFSQPWPWLRPAHRRYLLEGLPSIGAALADDEASYRYLGESILAHPPAEEVAAWLREAGLAEVSWLKLAGGIVAVHRGWKLG